MMVNVKCCKNGVCEKDTKFSNSKVFSDFRKQYKENWYMTF